jgi:hypothetical protein
LGAIGTSQCSIDVPRRALNGVIVGYFATFGNAHGLVLDGLMCRATFRAGKINNVEETSHCLTIFVDGVDFYLEDVMGSR